MIRALFFVPFLSLASISCLAQSFPEEVQAAAESIDPREIEAHVRFLADDLLEGRDTGSRGHEIAARYVASEFLENGLEPGGDDGSWFQTVPLRSARLRSGSLSFHGKDGPWTELERGRDFVVIADPEREESHVEAEAVFVGFGITAPELDWDDYATVDARGKVVLALRNAPDSLPGSQRAHYASTSEKRRNAAAHGALGLIEFSSPTEEARVPWSRLSEWADHPTMRWLRADGTVKDGLNGLEVHARINRKTAEKLFDGARIPLRRVMDRADSGKSTGSFELPVKVRLTATSAHEKLDSPNVVGILPGSDPAYRNEFVALVAHLDHVGIGRSNRGDRIYNGAHDNASGIAAMIAVSRAMARLPNRPARSIAFLAVTGEEKGLLGADYFANNPTEGVDEVVAAFSLDMFLMLFPVHDIIAFGAEHSTLGEDVEKATDALGIELSPDPMPEEVLFVRTDHYPFVKKGIPALYLDHGLESGDESIDGAKLVREWMKRTYHKPSDDLSQPFDWQAGADFAGVNLLLTWEVASDPERPRWNEGDFFGQRFGGQSR